MERRFFYFVLIVLTSQFLIQSKAYSQDSLEIERLKNQGKEYYDVGSFDAAELSFSSILLLDSNSIKARNNLGLLYKNLGRYNDALRVYFEGEGIVRRERGPNDSLLVILYINVGNIYNLMQDYDLALQYFNYANKICTDLGMKTYPANTVHANMGNTYYGMQEWRKALHFYKLGIEAKINTDRRRLDIAYANCATIYERLGELDSASMYFNFSIQEKIAFAGEETYRLIPTYVNYGGLLLQMGNIEEAFYYLSRALELAEERYDDKHPDVADCYRALATWYLASGEVDKALDHHQKAIAAVVFDFNDSNIYVNPGLDNDIMSEPGLLQILHDKALALEDKYGLSKEKKDLFAFLETLEIANSLAEKMRSSYLSEGSKLIITGLARTGFDRTIQAAYYLFNLTGDEAFANKAFIAAEKSKSSVLLASLQEVERKKNLAIPAEMQELERSTKKETEILKKKLHEERQRPAPDQFKLEKWQEQLFYLSQQLDSIDHVIREQFPEYAAKYDNEVVDLNGIMDKLGEDEVVLEYSMCDSCLYIFMVSKEKFCIERLDIDTGFHNDVAVLSQFLRKNDFASNTIEDYEAYVTTANNLYSLFLKPVESDIEGKKLLIIPDGDMGYIPFEALLTEKPAEAGMDY
ncbi:MAG: tetratricopeptide repeat protein, partial [Bacteroidota bacterium]